MELPKEPELSRARSARKEPVLREERVKQPADVHRHLSAHNHHVHAAATREQRTGTVATVHPVHNRGHSAAEEAVTPETEETATEMISS